MASCTVKGFSLLEMMIALSLLSIVLLGLNATQIKVLNQEWSLFYASISEQQKHVASEMLRAGNKDA